MLIKLSNMKGNTESSNAFDRPSDSLG